MSGIGDGLRVSRTPISSRRCWASEMETLRVAATHPVERVGLELGFDPFGDDVDAERAGHVDDGLDDC